MATNFIIYIPFIDSEYNISDIYNELKIYGSISSINRNKDNSYIIKYDFTLPIESCDGRTLKEDIIYRESNQLPTFTHLTTTNHCWIIIRKTIPIMLTDYFVNSEDIFASGL